MKKVVLSAVTCVMAFSANANVESSAFSGVYSGFGIGGSFFSTSDMDYLDGEKHQGHHNNVKTNRVVGSVVIGGGEVFKNNVYVGGEVLMDISRKKKTEIFDNSKNHTADYDMKGFAPQLDAKVGYILKNNSLVYGKLGCAWSRVSKHDRDTDKNHSKTKPGFVLGLGAEKAFYSKFSAALEGDYNFGFKWKDKEATADKKYTCNKGWTVRALVKHNVKY